MAFGIIAISSQTRRLRISQNLSMDMSSAASSRRRNFAPATNQQGRFFDA
jgi:hypothetical protein